MKLIAKIVLVSLGLLAISYIFTGIEVQSFYTALIVAIILGVLNVLVRPLLILFTLPINILTLGLFTLVINALLFWFVASFIDGFSIASFWWAFIGALVLSVINWLVDELIERT